MNDTATHPSRLLKITAVSAKWLLGLLIAAWLLFAVSVVVLHGWIVPRIGDYRGLAETQASRVLGVPVAIGALSAKSGTLFPTFELRDVVVRDASDREALRLARVVASVSPRSLWRLSFVQLYIQSPQLDVRLDALGKLHVAGLDMSGQTGSGDTRAADWFFGQREFVIEGGTVRWTDERRRAEPLLLTDVRFIARNGSRRHAMRLDATPPAGWGDRFTLRGEFRQPLLSVRRGNWQRWAGQLYAELPRIDVRRLGNYVSLDARIRDGRGGLRAWADVRDGQVVGGAADLALDRIDASLDATLEPLVLRGVTGRVAGQLNDQTFEFSTTALQFDTADGLRWPGGNLWFQHTPVQGRTPERGAFRADRLDLAALSLIAARLPLGDATHRVLAAYTPRGVVEHIDASWQGSLGDPHQYKARGSVSALSLASQPAPAPHTGTPGLSGAAISFDATQDGGKATLAIAQGVLDFPGVFEEPRIPIDKLSAQLQWKRNGDHAQLQVSDLQFENADAAGVARATWRTSDPAVSRSKSRYPGVLDLQGQLTRADGTRVHRYLPLEIPQHTRRYVQESVTKGVASTVDFLVRGDLNEVPFPNPRDGDFRIAAKVSDVNYAYAPPSLAAAGKALAWPALTGVSGDLIFERNGMRVRNARGRIVGAPGIEVTQANVQIEDMAHAAPMLGVDARARGPLSELLKAGAPLTGEVAASVAAIRATGNADYQLKLDLPLENMDKTKVQASVVLGGNDLQLAPEAPVIGQVHGTLSFTESGFQLAGVQGRLAGGETRVDGRGRYAAGAPSEMSFRAQGNLTADGLRAMREVAWMPQLAAKAGGGTGYAATLSVRDGTPEFSVSSSLQGLSLDLPAPLAKQAEASMPLQIDKKVVLREARAGAAPVLHDRISLELAHVASAHYLRDIGGDTARVINGALGVGLPDGEAPVAPARGVQATLHLAAFDLPAWQALFGEAAGPAVGTGTSGGAAESSPYLPTSVAVRAQALDIGGGRTLHDVVLGGSRDGALWRANVDAAELSGYMEYRPAQDGRIYARLSRLQIAASEAKNVESLLDEQPGTLPALDIVVDDFELLGRRLGRAEIVAVNRGGERREWRLNKLAFTMPEASFTAQGSWSGTESAQRRTAMDFTLDIADAGKLLERFNMKDVIRRGRGRLEGSVDWRGSPLSLDYPSLGGQLHVDVETGQFLKADPGLAKLLGVLSLQALPRRLTLDFRDIFSEGFAFDFVRGDATIANGVASTNNLQMKGVNAAVLMDGSADIAHETQNLRVVVVPEISAGTAALVATAINPLIGLSTFLAQALLSKPLAAAATQEFQIEGTWTDPKITKVPRRALPAARDALTKEVTP